MPFDDSAAFAANWKTILAVEMAMALAVLAGGLILALTSSGWGWLLAAAGAIYLFFAGGRLVKWRRLRQEPPGTTYPDSPRTDT